MQHPIHQWFIDWFESLLKSELLSFLAGHIIENDIIGLILINDSISAHQCKYATFILIQRGRFDLSNEIPQMLRLNGQKMVSLSI